LGKVSPKDLLLIGKVLRPHGVRGLLRIGSYAESVNSFQKAGTIVIRTGRGDIHEEAIISITPHKNIFLMNLAGVNSLEEAEAYRGASLFIKKDVLNRVGDEFFWHELIGLRVCLDSGEPIGEIRNILKTGGHDVYVVKEGDREILIPAVHDVIARIDTERGVMIIVNTEGLLDLNEV
jgi:16S rRNA processing protein RimM